MPDLLLEALRLMPREDFRARLQARLLEQGGEPIMTTTTADYVREGMRSINPYLVVRDGAQILAFLENAFGGQIKTRMNRPDGSIMHSEVLIGDTVLEMAQGAGDYPPSPMALHVYVPDSDTVYARALAAGAEPLYPVTDMPYGDREGGVKDSSGNYWFISTHQGARHVPEGLRTVTTGMLARDAAGLIDFVKRAFGAEERQLVRGPLNTVVHSKIAIGDSVMEISEAHGDWGPVSANLHLYVPDTDAAYARALEAGAVSQRPPEDAPYGDRTAGVVDRWGNQWWLATHLAVR